jgi:hypothetical protein
MHDAGFTGLRALESAVAEQVVPPSFDALVANAAHRRRNAYAAAASIAAGAVAVSVAVAAQGGSPRNEPAPPVAPTPTHASATEDRQALRQVVDDPSSIIVDFAVSQTDPDARAAIWRGCHDDDCSGPRVLTVTADGFASASYLPLRGASFTTVTAVGDDEFALWIGSRPNALVSASGAVRPIVVDDRPAPVGSSEDVISTFASPGRIYAVDPSSARAHPLTIPDGAEGVQRGVGALATFWFDEVTGTGPSHATVAVSHDRGASWQQSALTLPVSVVPGLVPSQDRSVLALLGLGDNTVPPLEAVWRSADGGSTWQRLLPTFADSGGDTAYVDSATVESDGSLVVNVVGWSDARIHHPSAHPSGLYRSDGADWSVLAPTSQPMPPGVGDNALFGGALSDVVAAADGSTSLYLQVGQRIYATDDAGDSWTEVSAR